MKKWLRKFEDAMVSATFAEAGEFETANETLKEKRTILLALTGQHSDVNAFRYAVNMCKRIGAELEILGIPEHQHGLEKKLRGELKKENVEYRMLKRSGCIKDAILEYTNRKKEILFVVIESMEGLTLDCQKKGNSIPKTWRKLKCPLVLVSEIATA
jgi:hypothetical protein